MNPRGKGVLFVVGSVAAAVSAVAAIVIGNGLPRKERRSGRQDIDVAREILLVEKASPEEQARCFARMKKDESVQRKISEHLRWMLEHLQAPEVRRLRAAWIKSCSEDDPGVRLLDACFAHYEGRIEEALALQQREVERMPRGDWRRRELREWSWISFLHRSILDTYDAWPDKQELHRAIWSPDRFSSLINVEQLAVLLATHRYLAPDDPMLPIYEQAVANHGRERSTANDAEVREEARRKIATLSPSELRVQIDDGSWLREDLESVLLRLEQLDDPDLFERLHCQLQSEDRASEAWRVFRYCVDWSWYERDWPAIVEMCRGGGPELVERPDLPDEVRWKLALALLHQGSVEDCRRALARDPEVNETKVLASVVGREPQRALELGRAFRGPLPLYPFNEYAMSHGLPGVEEFLTSDAWRELCAVKPVKLLPALVRSAEYDFLLFQRRPQPVSAEWLRDRLDQACVVVEEVQEMPEAVATQRSFRVTTSRDLYWVTIGSGPLQQRALLEPYLREPLKESLRPLADHRAWIAVQQQDSHWDRTTAGPIAAALADDETLGVVARDQCGNRRHLPSSPEFWEERRQGKRFISFDRSGDLRVPRIQVCEAHQDRFRADLWWDYHPWLQHGRRAAASASGGRITVVIYHGCAAESLTFDVSSVTHDAFGHYLVRARLAHQSQYQPCLVQGALAEIPSRFIHKWTLP